jgi:hypothetical protein
MKHPLLMIFENFIHLIQFLNLSRLCRITLVFLLLKSLGQVHGLSSILSLLFFNHLIPGFLLILASPLSTFLLLHYLVLHLMCPCFESECPLFKLCLLPWIDYPLCLLMLLLHPLSEDHTVIHLPALLQHHQAPLLSYPFLLPADRCGIFPSHGLLDGSLVFHANLGLNWSFHRHLSWCLARERFGRP